MSDVSPLSGISGLSLDSTLLSPLVLLPSPGTLSVLSFFCLPAHAELFLENSLIFFFVQREAFFFFYGSCLAARRSRCSMLPYGTGIYCYNFIIVFSSVHSLKKKKKKTLKKSGIDISTEWFHDTSVT